MVSSPGWKEKVKTDPYVIATGGLASLVYKESSSIDEVDEFLTSRASRFCTTRIRSFTQFK